MIKRLIFDLDNTIIEWKEEYVGELIKTMREFNVDYDYKIINNIIEMQEKIHDRLEKQQLLNDINSKCNLELPIEFIDRLLERQKKTTPIDDKKMKELFEYLNQKYEIVLLTNWFTNCQVGRLKNLGIDKYFNEFYGGDIVPFKPRKEAFIKAIGKCKPEECMMIGDSQEMDIDGALNVGINVIKVSKKNSDTDNKLKIIKNIYQLKELL